MRKIEFRAKYKITTSEYQQEGRWQYFSINFILQATGEHIQNVVADNKLDIETLGEFTGLKDKNGKFVFEGDILAIEWHDGERSSIGKVVYKEPVIGYSVINLDGSDRDQSLFWYWDHAGDNLGSIVVLGNIYDNPELLKEAA